MVFKKINRTIAITLSLLAFVGCQLVDLKKENKQMSLQEKTIEEFQVIGLKTRTSNSDEMKGNGKIPALWNAFYSQQVLNKIPHKIDQDVVAVYYNYESDANAPYSLLIGARVALGTKAPEGMDVINIPGQSYCQFTTKVGEMPMIVIAEWKNIWSLEQTSQLKRKYSYDLEVYGKNATNPKSSRVDLLISIK